MKEVCPSPSIGNPEMTYEQALQFWYGRINYEQRTLQMSDLKLDRMHSLLEQLGNPHHSLPILHIAGSKGKGSTSALLASVLQHAGYKTGLFTSPHLHCIEERFQINGTRITATELASLMSAVASVVEVMDRQHTDERARVTFFEIATALGFLFFQRNQVDVAILEVGLGGRFDATNVCEPLLSVITSISFDHTQQLGNTLAAIAFEKAGIIKEGRPALSGVREAEAQQVIEEVCRQRGAPLRTVGKEISFHYQPGQVTAAGDQPARIQVMTEKRRWPVMELALLGEHQAINAALAIAAVEELQQGFAVTDEAVAAGFMNVHWPARVEVVQRQPMVVLDCAHNPASAQALLQTFQESFSPPSRRFLIFACSQDKDVAGILRVLAPYFDHLFLTRYANNPRSVPPDQLAEIVSQISAVPFTICETPQTAWQRAGAAAGPDDFICITGSVFLAGELRPIFFS